MWSFVHHYKYQDSWPKIFQSFSCLHLPLSYQHTEIVRVSLHQVLCEFWASKFVHTLSSPTTSKFQSLPISKLLLYMYYVCYGYIINNDKIQWCKPFIASIWDSNSAGFSYTFIAPGLCSRPGTLTGMVMFHVPLICPLQPSLGIWFSWWWQVNERESLIMCFDQPLLEGNMHTASHEQS